MTGDRTGIGGESPPLVVIIGAGLAGLSAARRIARDGIDVTVLEASNRVGGRITTIDLAGTQVDAGPEAIVTYQPGGLALCRELGLGDELVAPTPGRALLYTRGALRPLPERLLQGAPEGGWRILRSGALSLPGALRAGLDHVLPRRTPRDASLGALVESRLGREAAARLVDPMLGNIHGGSIWQLDPALVAPQVARAASSGRSLIRGLRTSSAAAAATRAAQAPAGANSPATPPAASPTSPSPFRTLRGGLRQLAETLADDVRSAGVDIRLGSAVHAVRPGGVVELADGGTIEADAVLIAVPAGAAAQLVHRHVRGCTAR